MAETPPEDGPFQHLQMDFIELTLFNGYRYCLVVVDLFSGWVEAFPAQKATVMTMAKSLL